MKQLIFEHIQIALSALVAVAIATILAWLAGYFRIPQKNSDSKLSLISVFGAFGIYYFVQGALIPVLYVSGLAFWQGKPIASYSRGLNSLETGWFVFLAVLIAFLCTVVYSVSIGSAAAKAVWNSGRLSFLGQLKSFFIGILTWFLTYPWVVIVGQVVAIVLIMVYGEPLPAIDQEMVKFLKGVSNQPRLFSLTVAAVVFAVPITEEILFRGFLQNWLKTKMSYFWAILISSVLFAFLHFSRSQEIANWHIIIALFVVSCFLGYVYERQKTLWAPIGLHIAINAVSTTLLFF